MPTKGAQFSHLACQGGGGRPLVSLSVTPLVVPYRELLDYIRDCYPKLRILRNSF